MAIFKRHVFLLVILSAPFSLNGTRWFIIKDAGFVYDALCEGKANEVDESLSLVFEDERLVGVALSPSR